jgi:cytochrome c biogenesis protein CcdA
MLPYIGAIALISRADVPIAGSTLLVAGYCILMVLPALVLTVLRRAGSAKLDPVLERISRWSTKSAGSPVILWAAGLVGAALIIDAVVRA